MAAETEPPPGAGDSEEVSHVNDDSDRSTSFFLLLSLSIYSMIFSSGLKGFSSESPLT